MHGGNTANKKWKTHEVAALRDCLKNGKSLDVLAEKLGRSRHALRQYANRLGHKFRHRGYIDLGGEAWIEECQAGNDRFIQAMEAAGYKLVRPRKTKLNGVGSTR
jgi:ribosomal protein S14